jgi:H+/Cl- antiporter ClcA
VILAILVPSLSVVIDLVSSLLVDNLKRLVKLNTWSGLGIAAVQCISCSLVSILITIRFQYIEGSGIPETKSVIAGISIYKYMSMRTLCMKATALVFALGSGYFIGKEGPFVHLSACIANNLSKLKIFNRIHHKNTLRR